VGHYGSDQENAAGDFVGEIALRAPYPKLIYSFRIFLSLFWVFLKQACGDMISGMECIQELFGTLFCRV